MAQNDGVTKSATDSYGDLLSEMVELLEASRRLSARAVNSVWPLRIEKLGGGSLN